jgi:hypothetical protein
MTISIEEAGAETQTPHPVLPEVTTTMQATRPGLAAQPKRSQYDAPVLASYPIYFDSLIVTLSQNQQERLSKRLCMHTGRIQPDETTGRSMQRNKPDLHIFLTVIHVGPLHGHALFATLPPRTGKTRLLTRLHSWESTFRGNVRNEPTGHQRCRDPRRNSRPITLLRTRMERTQRADFSMRVVPSQTSPPPRSRPRSVLVASAPRTDARQVAGTELRSFVQITSKRTKRTQRSGFLSKLVLYHSDISLVPVKDRGLSAALCAKPPKSQSAEVLHIDGSGQLLSSQLESCKSTAHKCGMNPTSRHMAHRATVCTPAACRTRQRPEPVEESRPNSGNANDLRRVTERTQPGRPHGPTVRPDGQIFEIFCDFAPAGRANAPYLFNKCFAD